MGSHFTWFDLLGVSHQYTSVAAAMTATVLIIVFSLVGRVALGSGEVAIEPSGHLTLKGFFEAFAEFMAGVVHQVLGHHSEHLIPMFGAMFFYIVFNNLLGLVPGLMAATSDINSAFSIGLFSFVAYNAIGVAHAGWAYFKHYLGPIWWMIPILLPIEIISNFIRPLSLGIRLHVNMMADHTILGTFVDLTKVIIPVIFLGMGTFVSLVQAFVFTMLSMVYVLMATADDH